VPRIKKIGAEIGVLNRDFLNAWNSWRLDRRPFDPRARVFDVVDGQIEFVRMSIVRAAEFGTAIGKYAEERNVMLLEEGQNTIVEQVGGGDRRLVGVELCRRDLRIGVDEGLLIDTAHPFKRADIKSVLGPTIPGAFALKFAVRFFDALSTLQRGELWFRQNHALLRDFCFERFQTLPHRLKVMAEPDDADAALRN